MDSQLAVKPLERDPEADVREGWGPLGHQIAVPEPASSGRWRQSPGGGSGTPSTD